jgi:multidrug resistance efflux pump
MGNFSSNEIYRNINIKSYKSFSMLKTQSISKVTIRLLSSMLIIILIILFLPWTQNLKVNGFMSTLSPEQKPQSINSIIGGKITKWYVREGDFVKKGDTILELSEVKFEYFDPQLLKRVSEQIESKSQAINSYRKKVESLEQQIKALVNTRDLKIKQVQNYYQQSILKVQSDSIDLTSALINFKTAADQLKRTEELYKSGLKPLTEIEQKRMKLQETQAKYISAENKLTNSKNDMANAKMEILSQQNQFADKLAKAESEKWETLSNLFTSESEIIKMKNLYENYEFRSGLYFITAPQDGYITKSIKSGIGEIIKEGEEVVNIAPTGYEPAIEMYLDPMDLPLMTKGQKVRIIFDGWPAIVFAGWPDLSIGAFGGEVVAIDNYISDNGKYRILIGPDKMDTKWPESLRVGSGAVGMVLLNDVPIWYETWRQLNGFPPDFYTKKHKVDKKSDKDKK